VDSVKKEGLADRSKILCTNLFRGGNMKNRDHYDVAIDEILKAANGDARLALRTVLMQNVQLEATILLLSGSSSPKTDPGPRKDLN